MKEINIKIENIEARVCKDSINQKDNDKQNKYEIVQWHYKMDGDYCTVISFVDVDKDDGGNCENVNIRTSGVRLYEMSNYDKECYDDVLDTLLKFIFDKRR